MCENKIRVDKDVYVCHHHKLIWRSEPLKCNDCEILQQYTRKELKGLLDMGYKLVYYDYYEHYGRNKH
jgi:hypothetical protein